MTKPIPFEAREIASYLGRDRPPCGCALRLRPKRWLVGRGWHEYYIVGECLACDATWTLAQNPEYL